MLERKKFLKIVFYRRHTVYVKNPKESTKELLAPISEPSSVTRQKANLHIYQFYFYILTIHIWKLKLGKQYHYNRIQKWEIL